MPTARCVVEKREIFPVGVIVADQEIEGHGVEQVQYVGGRGAGDFPNQGEALRERWPSLVLVFQVRG